MAVDDLDTSGNADTVLQQLDELSPDVSIAVFPEYALTGFVADARVHATALESDGPVLDRITAAAENTQTDVVVGYLEKDDGNLYNALAYVSRDGDRTVYRKRHLWGGEAEFVAKGSDRVVVDTPIGSAGLVTCYDLNFVAESAAFTNPPVDALLVAGAWPAAHAANWDLLLRARALDGVRWVIGAGRTGERTLPGVERASYAGRSAIIRPDGTIAGRLNRTPGPLVRTIDPTVQAQQRRFIGSID